jgi:hypothetical protein
MLRYFFAGFAGIGAGAGAGAGAGSGAGADCVTVGCVAGTVGIASFFFSHPNRATMAITTRTRIETEYFFTKSYLLNEF